MEIISFNFEQLLMDNSKPLMKMNTSRGVLTFIFATIAGLILASLLMAVIIGQEVTTLKLRVATVLQDIMVFIAPALVTAIMLTRYPARFLEIDRRLPVRTLIMAVITMIVAIPAINRVVAWNESVTFPASMSGFEMQLRQYEENAAAMVNLLMGGDSIGNLILSMLIVGVLAGFSEELFFRGTLQRLLTPSRGMAHVAIWVTAFIFSAVHVQFFGFIPRLLLGAFFGYLLWWSGNLWLPIIIHAFNNCIVVYTQWGITRGILSPVFDKIGSDSWWWVASSVVMTVIAIYCLRRIALKENQSYE